MHFRPYPVANFGSFVDVVVRSCVSRFQYLTVLKMLLKYINETATAIVCRRIAAKNSNASHCIELLMLIVASCNVTFTKIYRIVLHKKHEAELGVGVSEKTCIESRVTMYQMLHCYFASWSGINSGIVVGLGFVYAFVFSS